jgi:hypothetical protein
LKRVLDMNDGLNSGAPAFSLTVDCERECPCKGSCGARIKPVSEIVFHEGKGNIPEDGRGTEVLRDE